MNGFNIYPIDTATSPVPANCHDLYSIYLLTGPRQLHRADQKIVQARTYLCFGAPQGVGTPEALATGQTGYCCLFTKAFVNECEYAQNFKAVPRTLLDHQGTRSYLLPEEQATYLTTLFKKMLLEQQTTYLFKWELVRSYLQLVFHEAMRLQPLAPKFYFRYYFRPQGVERVVESSWRSRRLGKR
ncbi:hypothetical protein [Hymenobacter volaticus]|uniref:Uncharacterized protein n=1 Tax=Hymenobacter volaticus TaxID=2932254 RepID=A0ABY4GG59_9BACT|nr:hypothetical protein [Hymenobacter volaticus]UOQ69958.1 hypothetical protein MUN86_30715 [Hymenobacter volaticus]